MNCRFVVERNPEDRFKIADAAFMGLTGTEMCVKQSPNYLRRQIMDPIEHIFIAGQLVGRICSDIGFATFDQHGCYVGTYPTKERARKALEREPQPCEHCIH